jgi:uncharacterized peroxidase-related enzyme
VPEKPKAAAKRRSDPIKREPRSSPADNNGEVMALKLEPAKLSPEMAAYFALCEEKLGFVPNVLKAFAFDMTKLAAFVAYRNDLMQRDSGLIAAAVSAQNRCYYCVTGHGASVRHLSKDPILGEQVIINYRAARLSTRQRAMLDFAVKVTVAPWEIEDEDREQLRRVGFSERDIWDIAAVAGFYNMTNRLASATDMRPNAEYHGQARS